MNTEVSREISMNSLVVLRSPSLQKLAKIGMDSIAKSKKLEAENARLRRALVLASEWIRAQQEPRMIGARQIIEISEAVSSVDFVEKADKILSAFGAGNNHRHMA